MREREKKRYPLHLSHLYHPWIEELPNVSRTDKHLLGTHCFYITVTLFISIKLDKICFNVGLSEIFDDL